MTALTLLLLAAPTAAPKVELLDFTATYCPACRTMDPIVDRMKKDDYPIRRIDVSANPQLTQRFGVDLLPTFVLVRDGKEIHRIVGPTEEAVLRRIVRSAVAQRKATEPKAAPQTAAESARRTREQPARPDTRVSADTATASDVRPAPRRRRPEHAAVRGQAPDAMGSTPMSASVRVKISDEARSNSGSGTIIDNHPDGWALVLTCAHVVNGVSADAIVEIDVFRDGENITYKGRILEHDLDADVGLISIRTEDELPVAQVAAPSSEPAEGDAVFSIGCGLGEAPTIRQMNVVEVDRYDGAANIECSTVPEQGRSGGGLFNKRGEIIGVCSAADEKRDEGLYAGPEAVYDILRRVGVHRLFEDESQPERFAEEPPDGEAIAADVTDDQVHVESRARGSRQLQDALAEAGVSEVTCVIRPLDGKSKSRVVIIHQASDDFLARLEGRTSDGPTPTMLSQVHVGTTSDRLKRPRNLMHPMLTSVRAMTPVSVHETMRTQPIPLIRFE